MEVLCVRILWLLSVPRRIALWGLLCGGWRSVVLWHRGMGCILFEQHVLHHDWQLLGLLVFMWMELLWQLLLRWLPRLLLLHGRLINSLQEIRAQVKASIAGWCCRFIKSDISGDLNLFTGQQNPERFEVRLSVPEELAYFCFRWKLALLAFFQLEFCSSTCIPRHVSC